MNDSIGPWELARGHYEHLLHEAEIERMLADAGIAHTGLQARMLRKLGALLLYCGQRLAPATPTARASDAPNALPAPTAARAEWRILANGDVIAATDLVPSLAATADSSVVMRESPAAVVVRMERAPEGSLAIACWNEESADQPTGTGERHVAVFYVTRELAPIGAA